MKRMLAVALATIGLALAGAALAQSWPTQPVRLVIAWPPGGGNDILGRMLAEAVSPGLGQNIVVENRGGANGLIGAEHVARSAPDGYTFMFHSVTTHLINPAFYAKVPYDTVNDFAAVAMIGEVPHVLVAHPSLPAKDLKELVALAKKEPGKLSYASFGNGSSSHLSGALFNKMLGIKLTHVAYKGGGPALNDTLGGHIALYFATVATALPSINAGKLRALAVTTARRSQKLPDVPTVDEAAGVKGYETSAMYGVWAPAKTPAAIVDRMNAEIMQALKKPEFAASIGKQGVEPARPHTPADMAAYIQAQLPKWAEVVKASGARAE